MMDEVTPALLEELKRRAAEASRAYALARRTHKKQRRAKVNEAGAHQAEQEKASLPVAWLIRDHAGRLGYGQWITQSSADLHEAHDQGCEITPLHAKNGVVK